MVLGAACGRQALVQSFASGGLPAATSAGASLGSAAGCSKAIAAGHAARLSSDGSTLASGSSQKSSSQRNCSSVSATLVSRSTSSERVVSKVVRGAGDHSSSTVCHARLPTLSWGALLPRSGGGAGEPLYALQSHDGSWNAAGDSRPARWHLSAGRQSAWLLFGACSCVAAAATGVVEAREAQNGAHVESSLKEVFKNYRVIGIAGDGRCLFRAVCHGLCLLNGRPAPSGAEEQKMADELRQQVVDEFVKRRADVEWFLEGSFDAYVDRMRRASTWGGEPELLMASHVLRKPITVYLPRDDKNGLIAIAEYGSEYGKDPIRVLYNGVSHYDALELPSPAQSKL